MFKRIDHVLTPAQLADLNALADRARFVDRRVGLTFIQSRIADPARRELLYELNEVAALEGLKMDPHYFIRLQRVRENLLRDWGDHD